MKKLFTSPQLITALLLSCLVLLAVLHLSGSAYADVPHDDIPDNGIPVVILHIDESRGTIEEMHESPDHSVYCYGTVQINVPEGFRYSDFPDTVCESIPELEMSIRGRGNSSWAHSLKKPYKIKLDKKTDVFGLGKNKHWVLLANWYDSSLMKDRITAWLGDQMDFEFTPRGVPVDLVMIGENYGTRYLGSYYLSENVRVDTNRLEIDELEEDDTQEPEITGGYLLQDAAQIRAGSPDRFYTKRGSDWATHTPSFDTEADNSAYYEPADSLTETMLEESFADPELGDAYENPVQQQYIQRHIQLVEDVLFSPGTGYRELMDVESAAKYWLINEISLNDDAFATGSTYIYKKRDVDGTVGKIYWGPLWDFDYAWDHRFTTEGFPTGHEWMSPLFCDREEGGFVEEVKKQWPVLRQALMELVEEGGIMDQYYLETKASAEQDHQIHKPDEGDFNYLAEVEHLKEWIRKRVAWVDENLSLLDTLVCRITYIVDGEIYSLDFADNGQYGKIDGSADYPEKEGFVFLGWADEDGQIIDSPIRVTRDMTLTAQYIPEDEATRAEDITFRKTNDVIGFNRIFPEYTLDYWIIPEDAQDKRIDWSSSDESIATVNEKGVISYYKEGTVTITASLRHGNTRTLELTINDGTIIKPSSIRTDKKILYMSVGDELPLLIHTDPAPARINGYAYESSSPEIAEVNDYGIIRAVGPGKATIHIKTSTNGENWGDIKICETSVNVIIAEKSSEQATEPEPKPTMEPALRPTENPVLGEANASEESSDPGTESETTPSEEASSPDAVSEPGHSHTWAWIAGIGVAAVFVLAVILYIRRKTR